MFPNNKYLLSGIIVWQRFYNLYVGAPFKEKWRMALYLCKYGISVVLWEANWLWMERYEARTLWKIQFIPLKCPLWHSCPECEIVGVTPRCSGSIPIGAKCGSRQNESTSHTSPLIVPALPCSVRTNKSALISQPVNFFNEVFVEVKSALSISRSSFPLSSPFYEL